MSNKVKKLQAEYKQKIADLDIAIDEEKKAKSEERKNANSGDDCCIAVISENISGLHRLKQAYVQFVHDLDDL